MQLSRIYCQTHGKKCLTNTVGIKLKQLRSRFPKLEQVRSSKLFTLHGIWQLGSDTDFKSFPIMKHFSVQAKSEPAVELLDCCDVPANDEDEVSFKRLSIPGKFCNDSP